MSLTTNTSATATKPPSAFERELVNLLRREKDVRRSRVNEDIKKFTPIVVSHIFNTCVSLAKNQPAHILRKLPADKLTIEIGVRTLSHSDVTLYYPAGRETDGYRIRAYFGTQPDAKTTDKHCQEFEDLNVHALACILQDLGLQFTETLTDTRMTFFIRIDLSTLLAE